MRQTLTDYFGGVTQKYELRVSFKRQLHKIVKHTQTIRRLLPTNRLNVAFDRFVTLALKWLRRANFL